MTTTGSVEEPEENPGEGQGEQTLPQQADKPPIVFNIDAVPSNADWPKRHWDLPTTLDEWRSPFKSDAELKSEFRKILTLPVARAMPESLIAELRAEYGEHFVPKYLDKRMKN